LGRQASKEIMIWSLEVSIGKTHTNFFGGKKDIEAFKRIIRENSYQIAFFFSKILW